MGSETGSETGSESSGRPKRVNTETTETEISVCLPNRNRKYRTEIQLLKYIDFGKCPPILAKFMIKSHFCSILHKKNSLKTQ